MDGIKVLVCEDERLVALELKERLEKLGHDVVGIASNFDDAIALARSGHPDLALMDVRLEGSAPGTVVANALKAQFDVPSIFLTAYSDSQTVADAQEASALGYLLKPVNDNALQTTIEIAMASHTKHQETKGELHEVRGELETYRAFIERMGIVPSGTNGGEDDREKFFQLLNFSKRMQELGEIIGPIAHFENNKLAAIMGYLDGALGCGTLENYERNFIIQAMHHCQELAMFIRQLSWTAQDGPRSLTTVNMQDLVSEVIAEARTVLRSDTEMITSFDPQKLVSFVDRQAVGQALRAVITNAQEAMVSGGILTIETAAELVDAPQKYNPRAVPGRYVVITVDDTGRGIPEDRMEELCTPFATTHDNPSVAGLGLSVAYGVTQAHGGWFTIDSETEIGTTVRLYFPQIQSLESGEG